MRIAILGSAVLSVPPKGQGGTELMIHYQAEGLRKRGHEIFLFAPEGSQTSGKLITVGQGNIFSYPFDQERMESSRKFRVEMVYLGQTLKELIDRSDAYDVVLNNMRGGESLFLPIAEMLKKPLVSVLHLPLFNELANVLREFNASLISISNAQRRNFPHLNYLATVYNGVDTTQFTFGATPDDYLLMVGTIGRHKNQGAAIRVAKKLRMKLVLAGRVRDADYFDELKKHIDGEQIVWKEALEIKEKIKLYQQAKAFLFPILWEEPFGLVMIEAMSCGTPVIAFGNGAVPEVVIDGKTGFIVNNEDEMVESVGKINGIDRKVCRKHVEENFTIERMVDGYEKLYQHLHL